MKYYLGPWRADNDGVDFWRAPTDAVGFIDLSSAAEIAQAQLGSDRSVGFFAVPDSASLPGEYELLGTGDLRELRATGGTSNKWQGQTGYRPSGDTLMDLLVNHLTNNEDVLVPTSRGVLEVHLGGHSVVWTKPLNLSGMPQDNRHRGLLLSKLQQQYADTEDAIGPDVARRALDYNTEKYFRIRSHEQRLANEAAWKLLLPPDRRAGHPGPLPHQTTITESFDKANSTTLGPDLTWSEFGVSSWKVDNNQAELDSPGSDSEQRLARAETALSGDDHYSQADIQSNQVATSGDSQIGLACRVVSGSTPQTYYFAFLRNTTAGGTAQWLAKWVSNSFTTLGGPTSYTQSLPHTVKVQSDGSSIKGYRDAVEIHGVTDTSITGNLYCGIYGIRSSGSWINELDDFEAADLAAGGGITYTQLERNVRGMTRGMWTGGI